MPIPPMLANPATLPPFTGGDPTEPGERSPYRATMEEVVTRFATSGRRREILAGLIAYRRKLRTLPWNAQFQWLCGSFVEKRGVEPGDVDVVTFYHRTAAELTAIQTNTAVVWNEMMELADPQESKRVFHCEAYPINLAVVGRSLVSSTHYWYGLFSHQRVSYAWKGIVEVEVASPDDDKAAESLLTPKAVP